MRFDQNAILFGEIERPIELIVCLPGSPNAVKLGRLNQNEIRDAYAGSDLLLLPSRLEGLPRAAMEAQACGVPAIVSDASSLREVVLDGVTGYICPAEDVGSYASAIRKAVADQDLYDAMSAAARQFVLENHHLDEMANKFIALCRDLLMTS